MYCKNCNREVPENTKFCPYCGAEIAGTDNQPNNNVERVYYVDPTFENVGDISGTGKKKKNRKALPIIITAVVCLVLGAGVALMVMTFSDKTDKPEPTVSAQQSEPETETDTEADTESEETLIAGGDAVTTQAPTTEAPAETKPAPTSAASSAVPAVTPDKLYRPEQSKYCNQYERYVSGNSAGQGYAKMRFGPDKYTYDVVGQIDNGSVVTVQTQSVNGWTLVYYNGKEGWVRTDFLFKTYDECFENKPTQNNTPAQNSSDVVLPDTESCGSTAAVDVTGQYDGEPLNMRSGPSKDYDLITTVPDGASVEVWGYSDKTSDWIYVRYNGTYGWVLSKYVYQDGVGDKPVLYLYPEKETDVDVKVSLRNMYFTCTYPEYGKGWSVTARPDGTLINKKDNKEYSYLYWELGGKQNYDFSKGFVVKGSDTAAFLQSALSEMGLTPKEYNEFIVYWLPKMQNNKYNLISFQGKEYTDNVRLAISPKPDSTLRVFMAYKALDEKIEIEPQKFTPFERKGFTVVEWGGAQVK